MTQHNNVALAERLNAALPANRTLYYGGRWQAPSGGSYEVFNPASGASLGQVGIANTADVDKAVAAAHLAFKSWRQVKPVERMDIFRVAAARLRDHAEELALIDAANAGSPIKDMIGDVLMAARRIEHFGNLATEVKGDTVPAGGDTLSMTLREPYGVCVRIIAYNHPLLFAAAKIAAPLATGNTVILKPAEQAPLSALRMAELIGDLFPAGVLSVLTGQVECGAALVEHKQVAAISLIGSVGVGRKVAQSAAASLKHVGLELGGKNAMVIYPDADLPKAIAGAVKGMNFGWCGQSCASTSRVFVHEDVYDAVVAGIVKGAGAFKPGIPTDMGTTMGAVVSRAHLDRIMDYVESGKREGAVLALGGGRPQDAALANGHFIEPTVFKDVTMDMKIAREEIFGPVLSIFRWKDEAAMLEDVNRLDFGLTAAIFTRDLSTAIRVGQAIEAGVISINSPSSLPFGTPFGGYKLSGIGRDSSIEELFAFTQVKNLAISL